MVGKNQVKMAYLRETGKHTTITFQVVHYYYLYLILVITFIFVFYIYIYIYIYIKLLKKR